MGNGEGVRWVLCDVYKSKMILDLDMHGMVRNNHNNSMTAYFRFVQNRYMLHLHAYYCYTPYIMMTTKANVRLLYLLYFSAPRKQI